MILVVVGPGGAGKGTAIRRLVERDANLWVSRSWTTRARREGEAEDAYRFVDRPTFEKAIADDLFLEHADILGELYGTPKPHPPEGKDVVLEIDVQGARQVLGVRPDAVVVLLEAPSEEVQAERLRGRGDAEEHVARRIELGRREIPEARAIASEVLVNDDLRQTVERLTAIIDAARAAGARPEESPSSASSPPTHEGA